MKKKIALITGVTGQDGSYLSEFLLNKNYIVHGIKRRSSIFNTKRIDHLVGNSNNVKNKNFILHFGDLTDGVNIFNLINKIQPDEIYNLGAQSHVSVSFDLPLYTADVNALGTLRILEAIRSVKNKNIKFYQASTSELFGDTKEKPQNEKTRFNPMSPYACSKLFAHAITINYRKAFKIFACNGILFNHESPRRGETFVTKKIVNGLCRVSLGLQKKIEVGNLYSLRDWGHAKDYAKMQWLMMQQSKPDDYVIATGKQYSVKQFIEFTAKELGVLISWKNSNLKEVGFVKKILKQNNHIKKNQIIVCIKDKYFRPSEVEDLMGDSKKAKKKLKWKNTTTIQSLIKEMVAQELSDLK